RAIPSPPRGTFAPVVLRPLHESAGWLPFLSQLGGLTRLLCKPDAIAPHEETAMHDTDIAIVGGGIAGLTAAVEAALGGMRVRLFERSERVGGRGISAHEGDFTFNLGPHALYDSHFRRALDDFGVPYSGRRPKAETAERAGRFHRLPINASNIATTRLLGMRDRFEFASMFTR